MFVGLLSGLLKILWLLEFLECLYCLFVLWALLWSELFKILVENVFGVFLLIGEHSGLESFWIVCSIWWALLGTF